MKRWLATIGLLGVLAAAPGAARAAQSEEDVKRDLFTVITLQGKPCGRVLSAERRGESDYVVRCESGDGYRVRLDADGRVAIERL